ncbi:50S ribosomal protein L15 [Rickettsiales bacterium Ac37b]|nr:50S ribosomal protein L15 [Rickettsiales bacterium Ac37b]
MKLNTIKDIDGARKNSKRLGRGIGSGKGKTCGKGVKGQKSRSGVAIKGFEGGQMPLHRRLPKRGFKSKCSSNRCQIINLPFIEQVIKENKWSLEQMITKEILYKAGIIKNIFMSVKLLAKGEITLPINIEIEKASKNVIEKITKLGGKVVIVPQIKVN